jgi:hypothetical protein
MNQVASKNDVGITVPGSISDQKFTTVSSFETEPAEVIILKLAGELGQNRVTEAVTVARKVECGICGTTNKYNSKFCKECGAALCVIA